MQGVSDLENHKLVNSQFQHSIIVIAEDIGLNLALPSVQSE